MPYIKPLPIEGCPIRFFYGTPQAKDWYDPLKLHTKLEFEWIARHIAGRKQKIIDAGAYHGLYTLVLAKSSDRASRVVAVDAVPSNCALIEVNLALNGLRAEVEECAINDTDGHVNFSHASCGRIISRGGTVRPARRLSSIMHDATIVKLDIEGAEFLVLPSEIDELSAAHTWIVEIHSIRDRDPQTILDAFRNRGFDLWWVNRDDGRVEPYPAGTPWTSRTSLIAVRS
ncbi:MAG: FkbM family methyltransferase [Geminicoccaceae bacterium]